MVCLTDVYETCYELLTGLLVPDGQAEDSFSFLDILLNRESNSSRPDLVSHSVHGEFAYRKHGWKIVFSLPEETLQESRGKPAKVELYHLDLDESEQYDSTSFHPEIVDRLTNELSNLVDRGTSKEGDQQVNDVTVDFTTIQRQRWAL
jgi:hypothetical protein